MTAKISNLGHYVPEKIITNYDLETMVDTDHDWIVRRTGIHERRICAEKEFTSDMAIKAVQKMLDKHPNCLEGVDQIITATMTPDYYCPNVSSMIQAHFKLPLCGATDLNAACSGFVYALMNAHGFIAAGHSQKVLVIGADAMSKIVDFKDRTTCILFGDAAGAAIVEKSQDNAFIMSHKESNGELGHNLYCAGLSHNIDPNFMDKNVIRQNGKEVFKWAVQTVTQGVATLLEKANITANDIDWFIPHSANQRIIEAICKKIDCPENKVLSALEYYGNSSAGTIPLALSQSLDAGKIKPGQTLLLYGFGGGLTHSGLILKWQ